MSEISPEIPPVPQNYDPAWLEEQLRQIKQDLWKVRFFLEPAVKNNENCPEQEFSPLE